MFYLFYQSIMTYASSVTIIEVNGVGPAYEEAGTGPVVAFSHTTVAAPDMGSPIRGAGR